MKLKFLFNLFFVFIFCTNINLLSQGHALRKIPEKTLDSVLLRVTYKAEQQALKDNEPFIVTDTMALDIGGAWSVYYDQNRKTRDSISGMTLATNPVYRKVSLRVDPDELQSRLDRDDLVYHLADASKGESAKILKLRSEKRIITIDDHIDTFYRLQEQPLTHEWVITNDTLTILNYVCQNAIAEFRGRIYSVWFTIEIPVNDGPWKLYGLPGLILKAEDSERIFSFEAVGLMHTKEQYIKMTDTKRFIECADFEQLQKIKKRRFENVFYGFVENGSMVYFSGKNPIEYSEIEKGD